MKKSFALCFILAFAACAPTQVSAQNTFWALDEEDQNRIFGWSDYTSGTSAVDYGLFRRDTGSGYSTFVSRDIEAMALTDGKIGYLLDEFDSLYQFDFSLLTPGSSNLYDVTTISGDIGLGGEGMAYNRFDGMLYLAEVVGSASNTDTTPDRLIRINPLTGATSVVGTMSGLGQGLGYTDGLEFNHTTGALYAFDSNDKHLYQIDTATGAITAVLDNDVQGGLSSGADIETLAWDSATGWLIGVDNNNNEIVELTFGNGGNRVLSNYGGHLGTGRDFEGSGMFSTVPEPGNAFFIGVAAMALLFRRRR